MTDDFSTLDPMICSAVPGYAALPYTDRIALCEYGIIKAQADNRYLGEPGTVILIVGAIISIVATAIAGGVAIVRGIVESVQAGRIARTQKATAAVVQQAQSVEASTQGIESDLRTKTITAQAIVIGIAGVAGIALLMALRK